MVSHYGIVGPGALGLLWASKLAQRHRVSLWGRAGPMALDLNLMTDGREDATANPPVRIEFRDLSGDPPELALITTKSPQALQAVVAAVAQWRQLPQALVLFQNGIGSQDEIAAAFPQIPVIAAATTEGAHRPAPGILVHAGSGLTRLGLLQGPDSVLQSLTYLLQTLAEDFTEAGLKTERVADIQAALWDKLLVNAGINPFTVLLDVPNGKLLGHPYFEAHIGGLCEELARVSQARGFPANASAIEARIRQVACATATNISSMLQDARAQRTTEIDYINGAVVAVAQAYRLCAPVNAMLRDAVIQKTDAVR